jgi:hypothetical protein
LNNHKIYDYKLLWKTKQIFKNINLKFNVFKFKAKNKYLLEKERLSVRKVYLFEIIKNIIIAFFFVILLYLIEFFSQNTYLKYVDSFPDWLRLIIDIIPKPNYPESKDAVNGFISLLASISGVLLALFYPILATIASSGYAKVNSSIRNLLFLEPITQNYLRRLAFLTAYSVCVFLFVTFGFYPGNLILTFLAILSLISLFNLLKIGSGVYSLFEPDTLAKIANKQIVDNIKNVTIHSAYWNNSNFQLFFRRQVEKDLEILRLLNVISIEGVSINERSFLNTITQTLGLLEFYLNKKNNIPLKSKWFKNKREHKSYFETDMHNRELSISNRSYFVTNEVSNNFWFEEQIFTIYSEIGKKVSLLENQEIRYKYLNKSTRALQYFGYSFEYDLANKLLLENLSITKGSLIHKEKNTYGNSENNLILIETMISSSIRDYHLSFFNSVEALNITAFNAEITKIDWNEKSSLYKLSLPYKLNSFFEEYFNYIKNEKLVENQQITPVWYITQHITAEYLILVEKNFNKTIEQIKSFVLPLLETCKENNNHLAVAFTCQCALELIDKIKFRIPRISKIIEEFDSNNLHKGTHTWTKLNSKDAYLELDKLEEVFILEISETMKDIYTLKWDENSPDIFAKSFSIISSEINKSFIENDVEKFKKIFPGFLRSSLASFYTLYHDRYKDRYHHHLEIIYQVHIELMQLSGLGYIYSELYNSSFWLEITKCWDEIKMDENQIKLIISSYKFYTNHKLGTGINFSDNFNRKKRLSKVIEDKKINATDYINSIIRRYVDDGIHTDDNYEEIFLEMYLFTFLDAKEGALEIEENGRRSIFFDINRIIEDKYGKK